MKHNRKSIMSRVVAVLMMVIISVATISADNTMYTYGNENNANRAAVTDQTNELSVETADQTMETVETETSSDEQNKADDNLLEKPVLPESNNNSKTGYQPVEAIETEIDSEDEADVAALSDEEAESQINELRKVDGVNEWTKYSSDYYYDKLSTKEKLLYDRLEASCLRYLTSTDNCTDNNGVQYMSKIDISDLDFDKTQVDNVMSIFNEVEGQYYFICKKYGTVTRRATEKITAVNLCAFDKFGDGNVRAQYTAKVKSQIQSWLNEVNKYSSQYEKQKAAHDLIVDKVTFNKENEDDDYNQSIVTALLNTDGFSNKTVCDGYAKTFQLLCNAAGVNSIITISDGHAWNYACINGEWYNVDCTWDDSELYEQFNIAPYLDINYETIRRLDDSVTHEVLPFWNQYIPTCSKNYIPAGAATTWKIGDKVTASLDANGTLKVTGSGNTYNYTSNNISPLVSTPYMTSVHQVVISEGVNSIGSTLFLCGAFTDLTIPASVKTIDDNAFVGSLSLKKIVNKSAVSKSFYSFFGTYSHGIYKDSATGKSVYQLPAQSTITKYEKIYTDEIYMPVNELTLAIGQTYQLKAVVYPYNTTNKQLKWSSSNPQIASVDQNGNVKAVGNGASTIYVIGGDGRCQAYCQVYVKTNVKNGVYQAKNGKWYYYKNDVLDYDYTGLASNEFGWWCIQKGEVNFNYNGLMYDPVVGWWYVEGGAINFGATGLVANEFGWWYVQNGGIDFNYTGLVFDPNVGWWYVQNGGINFGYTGKVTNEYGTWNVVNGQVIF